MTLKTQVIKTRALLANPIIETKTNSNPIRPEIQAQTIGMIRIAHNVIRRM